MKCAMIGAAILVAFMFVLSASAETFVMESGSGEVENYNQTTNDITGRPGAQCDSRVRRASCFVRKKGVRK